MTFWRATLETRHFDFVAYAAERDAVLALMEHGWERHRRQTDAQDQWHDIRDDVQVAEIQMNTVYRDGSALYAKES